MNPKEKTAEGYQVLARRFRPAQFDEILGQEGLVTTLKNSVRVGRVGHAYLFCGPRGVGKTTVARILAKALNCAKGPTETPCDQCPNCLEITASNAMDVLEIDGASNRGIDEIRNLRENVLYAAASSRYKIYIIDEVHMLTQEAFNALLKTLEEPPPHVKFFFATTDSQKLPATILSRCQKFELRRIPSNLMAQRLSALAKREKVLLSQDALLAVIAQAQGSMRDAESLLEVLIACGKTEIDYACVQEILGLSDLEIFRVATDAVFKGDSKGVLDIVAELFYQGKEPSRFLVGFSGHLRNLLLAKILGEKADALEMPAQHVAELRTQGKDLPEEHLVALLDFSTRTEQQMRTASNSRIVLELFFMKALEYCRRPALSGLLARLEQLESRLGSGTAPQVSSSRIPTASVAVPPAQSGPGEPVQISPREPESDIKTTWGLVAQSFGSTNPVIRTCMQDVSIMEQEDGRLLVHLAKGATFQKATLEEGSCKALIEQRLGERLGRAVTVQVDFFQEFGSPSGVSCEADKTRGAIENDPAVAQALRMFKGKIIKTTKGEQR